MTRTDEKVGYSPTGKRDDVTPFAAALGTTAISSRRGMLRFSELERAIAGVSQKRLIQQLYELERDGIVARRVHAQVRPKVEYCLTDWGQAMCPALYALLEWGAVCPTHESDR